MVLFVTFCTRSLVFMGFFLPICDFPLLFFLFETSCIVNCFSQSAFVDFFEMHWQPPRVPRLQVGYLRSHFASCYHAQWRYFLFSTNKQTNKKKHCRFFSFFKNSAPRLLEKVYCSCTVTYRFFSYVSRK